MGFQSIQRVVRPRGALVAVVALAVVLIAWDQLGLRRDSGETWQVERSADGETGTDVRRPVTQLDAMALTEPLVGRDVIPELSVGAARHSTGAERWSTVAPHVLTPRSMVRVRLQPLLADGRAPRLVSAVIVWGARSRRSWLSPAVPDESGTVTFRAGYGAVVDDTTQIIIGTSEDALRAAGDRRLIFGHPADQIARRELSSIERTDQDELTLDLGVVSLAPPAHLGTLRFLAVRAEAFDVTFGRVDDTGARFSSVPRQSASTRRRVEPGAAELRFATFADPTDWWAVVTGPDGRKAFRHTGRPGEVVDVVFGERQGVTATIDLGRHTRAARVVVLSVPAPQSAPSLGRADYKAREADAVRIMALPMPDRRGHLSEYPLGHVDLDDGSYRVELWSLRDEGGTRERLAFRTFLVAGDRTEMSL